MSNISKESTITIKVGLDDQKHPRRIDWAADDQPNQDFQEAKGMLVSFFDKVHLDTFKIDIWTGELQIGEMDRFMYQTLRGLADTYFKATRNQALSNDMQRFVQYFGEQTEIIPIDNPQQNK